MWSPTGPGQKQSGVGGFLAAHRAGQPLADHDTGANLTGVMMEGTCMPADIVDHIDHDSRVVAVLWLAGVTLTPSGARAHCTTYSLTAALLLRR